MLEQATGRSRKELHPGWHRHKTTFVRFLYRSADGKDSPQSIARIDRMARKVDICRTFSRAVLLWVIDPQRILQGFLPDNVTAVDAVATLRVLSGWFVLLGEVRLCVYPSAGTKSMHLPSDYI
jgi:hypothetical protein